MVTFEMSDETLLKELGSRIARARLNKNVTQDTLAKEAGVSLPTVQRIEAGHSTQLTNLLRILRALRMTQNLDALLPAPPVSPLQKLKMHGKERRRASGPSNPQAGGEWSWEEKK